MKKLLFVLTFFGVLALLPGCGGAGGRSSDPVWAMVFQSHRDGNGEIYGMLSDGSGTVNLSQNIYTDAHPSFNLDGSKVVFHSDRGSEEGTVVMIMNADGSGQTMVSSDDGFTRIGSVFSPDGTRIAFAANLGANSDPQSRLDIYLMNPDGSGITRLTHADENDSQLAFSRDGTMICFTSNRDGNAEIYVMSHVGGSQTRLTGDSSSDSYPSFSPDGSRIIFASDRDGDDELYIMDIDGFNLQKLTDNSSNDTQPQFTPDGRQIAFTSDRDGDFDIYFMDLNGANLTQVTNAAGDDRDLAFLQ